MKMIFTGNNLKMFDDFRKAMTKEFEMSDIGYKSHFFGVEKSKTEKSILISPKKKKKAH